MRPLSQWNAARGNGPGLLLFSGPTFGRLSRPEPDGHRRTSGRPRKSSRPVEAKQMLSNIAINDVFDMSQCPRSRADYRAVFEPLSYLSSMDNLWRREKPPKQHQTQLHRLSYAYGAGEFNRF